MKRFRTALLSTLLWCAVGGAPQSAGAGTLVTSEFGTIQNAIDTLGTSFYLTLDPEYSETARANFSFSTLSRRLSLRYGTRAGEIAVYEGGTLLATFNGSTRSDAEVLLKAFLTEQFLGSTEALTLNVANTPDDPVAGSPLSLQARMAESAFQNGSDVGPGARTGGSRAQGTLGNPHLGLALQSGRYRGPGFSASISTLPLSYSIPLNDPRWAVKLDFPITFAEINGVQNLSASLGVGLRIPVFDNWTLTPELRIGATRNRAQRTTAKLVNASIVSNFVVPTNSRYGVTIGNALTYSTTFGSAYKQSNIINKNGIEISGPFEPKLYGLPTNWEFSVVHTKVGGDAVFIDEWVDVSLSVGTIGSKNNVTWDSVRVGITYTRANRGVEGLNINFGYEF